MNSGTLASITAMKLFMSAVPRPIKLVVARVDGEGLAVPGLAVDRDDVAMARQHDAAAVGRPDGGEEIGLAPRVSKTSSLLMPPAVEIVAHEIDEREVGFAARGVEPDQPPDHLDAREAGTRHGRILARRMATRQSDRDARSRADQAAGRVSPEGS